MKNKKRLILIVLCSLFLCGCNNDDVKTPNLNNSSITPTRSQEPTVNVPDFGSEIEIYSVNASTLQKEAVTALISGKDELAPEDIIELVDATFEERGFYIVFDKVETRDLYVIVSFDKNSAQLQMTDKKTENLVLDAIAQSLLDNLDTCKGVIFRVNDGQYKSLNNLFAIDDVYMGR